jgi:hypothetical protein
LQDWANPYVRPYLHIYPEVEGPVTELWQAGKWVNDIDIDQQSPMWLDLEKDRSRHFYVKELARLNDGSYVIPMKWVTVKGVVHMECLRVVYEVRYTFIGMAYM